jgi:beta-mannanase
MFYKRRTLFISAFAGIIFTLFALYHYSKSNHKKTECDALSISLNQQSLGLFIDGSKPGAKYNIVPQTHLDFKWMNMEPTPLEKKWLTCIQSKKSTLICIQTWSSFNRDPQHVNVLEDVVGGKYDDKIRQLCADLAPVHSNIILTLDPEMEVPVKDYPWQYQSPRLYIQAFRHFYHLVKRANPNLKVMWSTAGYPGADEYWPGADAADVIGVLLFGQSELKTTAYPSPLTLQAAIVRKMFRMRMMQKPLLFLLRQQTHIDSANKKAFASAENLYLKETSKLAIQTVNNNGQSEKKIHNKLLIGVYDPKMLLIDEDLVTTEHIFADWGSVEDGSLTRLINEANHRRHNIILTIEPWRGIKWPTDPNVLERINTGYYDPIIKETARKISKAKYLVFLRFAHEMEIPINRYTWQSKDPIAYVKAFRHFMAFFKTQRNVRKVWGPAGDRGSLEWWPGEAWVDYISIAVYGLPDKNITDPLKQESFATIFNRKNYRMRFINKPLFITEFGVKGPAAFQKAWLLDAAATIIKNENIAGISYFNLADNPKAWGKITPPNWGISKITFQEFVSKVL